MILWDDLPPVGFAPYTDLYRHFAQRAEEIAEEDFNDRINRQAVDVFDAIGTEMDFEWDLIDVNGRVARALIACCKIQYLAKKSYLHEHRGKQMALIDAPAVLTPPAQSEKERKRRTRVGPRPYADQASPGLFDEQPPEDPHAGIRLLDIL